MVQRNILSGQRIEGDDSQFRYPYLFCYRLSHLSIHIHLPIIITILIFLLAFLKKCGIINPCFPLERDDRLLGLASFGTIVFLISCLYICPRINNLLISLYFLIPCLFLCLRENNRTLISPLIIKKGMMIYYHSPEGKKYGKAINLLLIYVKPSQILP